MTMVKSETTTMVDPVGAVVLAGGRSRRFGGQDKGLILLAGQPLVAWVVGRLRAQVHALAISANRNQAAYAEYGQVVADAMPGQPGPLAGVHAASCCLEDEWVLTAPCDMPFLPVDLVGRLYAGARQAGVAAVYAADDAQAHYTIMLIRRTLLTDIPLFLDQGGRRVQDWLARVQARPVRFGDAPQAFFNVNTPEDLERAGRLATLYPTPG
jgi:molybdopterin-guanine dinucleotide biosynthesis protein A